MAIEASVGWGYTRDNVTPAQHELVNEIDLDPRDLLCFDRLLAQNTGDIVTEARHLVDKWLGTPIDYQLETEGDSKVKAASLALEAKHQSPIHKSKPKPAVKPLTKPKRIADSIRHKWPKEAELIMFGRKDPIDIKPSTIDLNLAHHIVQQELAQIKLEQKSALLTRQITYEVENKRVRNTLVNESELEGIEQEKEGRLKNARNNCEILYQASQIRLIRVLGVILHRQSLAPGCQISHSAIPPYTKYQYLFYNIGETRLETKKSNVCNVEADSSLSVELASAAFDCCTVTRQNCSNG